MNIWGYAWISIVEPSSCDRGLGGRNARDQVRHAKTSETAGRPFQFKYQPENKDFKLEIKFRRDNVSRQELITVLEEMLLTIKAESE